VAGREESDALSRLKDDECPCPFLGVKVRGTDFVLYQVSHIERSIVVVPLAQPIPEAFHLLQNYPNPFNPETWIPFKLAQDTPVAISIYDTKGQLIRTIALGNKNAGIYTTKDKAAYWDGRDSLGQKVSSGAYYYTLQAGEYKATRKMVILK